MVIDTLKHLKEGIEFSESDFSEYSDEDEYEEVDDEVDDEVVSADECLPSERRFDSSTSGNDYRNRDIKNDEEEWLRIFAQARKEREGLSKRRRSLSDYGDDESEKEEEIQPSCMENSLQEQPRSRSPSSGPLTSKHFDFVLTSEAPPQSPTSIESAKSMKENQPTLTACADYPEPLVCSGKANGRFICSFACLF